MKEFITQYWLETLFGLVVTFIGVTLRQTVVKYKSIQNGMLSLLRAELIRSGEKYIEQGWIPYYAREAYEKAYKSYHGLGGNGSMAQLFEAVMKLPTVRPKNRKGENK